MKDGAYGPQAEELQESDGVETMQIEEPSNESIKVSNITTSTRAFPINSEHSRSQPSDWSL